MAHTMTVNVAHEYIRISTAMMEMYGENSAKNVNSRPTRQPKSLRIWVKPSTARATAPAMVNSR